MKKLLMFFAVAGFAIVGASCSNDSGGDVTPPEKKQLVVTVDNTTVEVGSEVTFVATASDAKVTDVEFWLNNKKGSNPYKFDETGTYSVIGKKEGFADSKAVEIIVVDKPVVKKKLQLVVSSAKIKVGDMVTFTAKADANDVADVVIKLNGNSVTNPWKAEKEGKFSFIATKEGFEDSTAVVVEVEKAGDVNVLDYNGQKYAVKFVLAEVLYKNYSTDPFVKEEHPVTVPFPGGGYGNVYDLYISDSDGNSEAKTMIMMQILVKNSTVIANADGSIKDYGTLAVPGVNSIAFVSAGFDLQSGKEYVEVEPGATVTLNISDYVLKSDMTGSIKVVFNIVSGNNVFKLNYDGFLLQDDGVAYQYRTAKNKVKTKRYK